MRVVESFKAFNADCSEWKSTSLNGWEYFIMWEDLGSSPMYANCMIFYYVYYFQWDVLMWLVIT